MTKGVATVAAALLISTSIGAAGMTLFATYSHAAFFSFVSDAIAREESPAQQTQPGSGTNLQNMALLSAPNNKAATGGAGGGDILIRDDEALVAGGRVGPSQETMSSESGQIRVYVVKPGDSLSQIAGMFGVSVNTIRWQNNISSDNPITPGQELIILPITGVQHEVEDGDTVASIAEKYDAKEEEIRNYNNIAQAGRLSAGDEIIIPSGEMGHQQVTPAESSSRTHQHEAPRQPRSGGSTGAVNGDYASPAPNAIITQRTHGYNAVDCGGSYGSAVTAAAPGTVIISRTGWNGGYGNYIVIDHDNNTQTLYSHNSRNLVGVGTHVERGQKIAEMGSTGKSTGNHVHFEVRGAENPFRSKAVRSACR